MQFSLNLTGTGSYARHMVEVEEMRHMIFLCVADCNKLAQYL